MRCSNSQWGAQRPAKMGRGVAVGSVLRVVVAGVVLAVVWGTGSADAREPKQVEWEQVAGEPVERAVPTLAERLSGRFDREAPEGVLAVIGDYRGGGSFQIADIDVAPDGRQFALAGEDGYVYIWNLSRSERVASWSADPAPESVAYSPDGGRLAVISGYRRNVLSMRDADSGDVQWERTIESLNLAGDPVGANFQSMAVFPKRDLLATSSALGGVWIWNREDGSIVKRIRKVGRGALAVSADGETIAVAGGSVESSCPSPCTERSEPEEAAKSTPLDLSASLVDWNRPDPRVTTVPAFGGRFAAFASAVDRAIFNGYVDAGCSRRPALIEGETGAGEADAASDQSRRPALYFRDLEGGEQTSFVDLPVPGSWSDETPDLIELEVSEEGRHVVAAVQAVQEDREGDAATASGLVVLELVSDKPHRAARVVESIEAPRGCTYSGVEFIGSEDRLVAALRPGMALTRSRCVGRVIVYGTDSWNRRDELRTMPGASPPVYVAFSEGGHSLRVERRDGAVEVYNLPELTRRPAFEGVLVPFHTLQLRMDAARRYRQLAGETVAATRQLGKSVVPTHWQLRDIDSGRLLRIRRLETAGAGSPVAVSRDLRTLVTAGCAECRPGWKTIDLMLWRVDREDPIPLPLPGDEPLRGLTQVKLSPDGSRVVGFPTSYERPVVWDVTDTGVRARLGPPVGTTPSWALALDGSVLVAAKADGSVLFWDLRSGIEGLYESSPDDSR